MGKVYLRYHHIGSEYGEAGSFDCPHCGKGICFEARTLSDGSGDHIIIAFARKFEHLDKEFKSLEEE